MDTPKILMGRENPNGWKLESLLHKIEVEVSEKSFQISKSDHPQRDMIMKNNNEILGLLATARKIQVSTYEELDAVEPNKGPLNPRL